MSLTSFLKDADEVRIVLDQTFEKPDIEITKERLAEPQTTNYALIGTAFDYVLRFWLEREYNQAESKPWVAHKGVNLAHLMEMKTTTKDGRGFNEVMASIEQRHQEYLETGEMTDELLASTLDLARFDWIYRSGKPPENLGEALDGDIEDLRCLYDIIPRDEFRGANHILLNPTFGSASHLVSGADADIVLDEMLVDIKTVKNLKLKPDYWRQLVGYVVLADLAGEELDEMPRFSDVGIYYARHGVLWKSPATDIYEHEKYEQFKHWFCEKAEEHFGETI
ncbi:hypothetical protein SY89_02725 [Halolamina pelagica]|uniref:Uncharacterized protein n=1 Tax=Halolamina pelagica TaxID=699431 RepID=A0A0P7HE62_9EURY|nr:hypothetical protein [Halolamina pelagica]KPN31968.1 hypothetical protein SY89_02725 [Halolamina pelagica]